MDELRELSRANLLTEKELKKPSTTSTMPRTFWTSTQPDERDPEQRRVDEEPMELGKKLHDIDRVWSQTNTEIITSTTS